MLDAGTHDFKVSANEFLDRADAVILHKADGMGMSEAKWDLVSLDRVAGKPQFLIQPPPYVTPEIVSFVREQLAARIGV